MKNPLLLFITFIFFGCSPQIKSITSYEQTSEGLSKKTYAEFDLNGNQIKEIWYRKSDNHVSITTYENNLKKSKTNSLCHSDNKCDLQTFSNYTQNNNLEKETIYVADSLVWKIKETTRHKGFDAVKIFSWESVATKIPNYNEALKITDTLFYDRKNRLSKIVSYSRIHKGPFEDIYIYSSDGYAHQIKGTRKDTIYYYKYSKEQKTIVRYLPRYKFYPSSERIYKIEYY